MPIVWGLTNILTKDECLLGAEIVQIGASRIIVGTYDSLVVKAVRVAIVSSMVITLSGCCLATTGLESLWIVAASDTWS